VPLLSCFRSGGFIGLLHTLKPKERIRLRYLELHCLFISFMLKSVKIVKILFHQSINQLINFPKNKERRCEIKWN